MQFRMFILLFISTSLLTGCASMITGQNQAVSVDTFPEKDAICTLSNDEGTWFISSTPGSTTILRSGSDLIIACEKPGISKGITTVQSSTKGMVFGNILNYGVGAAVDCGTGAAYDYPTLIKVKLNRI